jgi:hypothetical protein
MFDPAGSEQSDEFIEIFNVSESDTVDLQGWKISDGQGEDAIIEVAHDLKIHPNQFAVIFDPDYFQTVISYEGLLPDEAKILTLNGSTFGSRGLSNQSPETIQLINSNGEIVAEYTYSVGNISGHSDEKVDPVQGDDGDNWKDSYVFGGTPGFQNSVSVKYQPSQIDITVHPNPFSPNGDGYEEHTQIKYWLCMSQACINLRIFDIYGNPIRTILSAWSSGPIGSVIWDGRDDKGHVMSTGVYILILEALDSREGKIKSKKATIVLVGR